MSIHCAWLNRRKGVRAVPLQHPRFSCIRFCPKGTAKKQPNSSFYQIWSLRTLSLKTDHLRNRLPGSKGWGVDWAYEAVLLASWYLLRCLPLSWHNGRTVYGNGAYQHRGGPLRNGAALTSTAPWSLTWCETKSLVALTGMADPHQHRKADHWQK